MSKLKNILGSLAPTLGAALGGPIGGQAGQILSSILGVPNNPKSLEQAMNNLTAEQMAELKMAENDFKVQMKELEVDVFALEVDDKQDARKKFSKDWTPRILGTVTLAGFFGYIFLVTVQPPDANSDTIVSLVLGYLGGLASAVISFYFGASNTPDKEDK
jgi:Fe2+ transport system protein B